MTMADQDPGRDLRQATGQAAEPCGFQAVAQPILPRWGWLLLAVAGLAFLYAVRHVLLPFVLGIAIGYLLDPVADRLERLGLPRTLAALVTLAGFFLLGGILLGAFWPLFKAQFLGLVAALPGLLARLEALYREVLASWAGQLQEWGIAASGHDLGGTLLTEIGGRLGGLARELLLSGMAVLNLLGLLLITPVVAFYLLKDWDRITAGVLALVPEDRRARWLGIAGDVDRALAGFVRGQLLVMAADAVLYAAGWLAIGLPYALVLGLLAGLLAIVPFLGPLFALITALAVGFGSWGADPVMLGAVVGVFLLVQAIEGSVLSPRLVGSQVGLHPVLVLFAVFAGGELAGVLGVFLAVPVAAVALVLLRHALLREESGAPERAAGTSSRAEDALSPSEDVAGEGDEAS